MEEIRDDMIPKKKGSKRKRLSMESDNYMRLILVEEDLVNRGIDGRLP